MAKSTDYTKTNSTGALSFSHLRDTLNGATSGETSLSQYYQGSFNVPTANINSTVPVAGSGPGGSNPSLSFSQLRGRLSRVVTTITGTEVNLNSNDLFYVDSQNEYTSNLRKTLSIQGTVGATGVNGYALTINTNTTKLDVDLVSGGLYGYRGSAGGGGGEGGGGGGGQSGGSALRVEPTVSGIVLKGPGGPSPGRIVSGGSGGGGGGGGGRQGGPGRNYVPRCCGWFCPNQGCGFCGSPVGGGNQGGGSGGSGGGGAGATWNGSTLQISGADSGNGGQGPRGGSGGGGGSLGNKGSNGNGGGQGPSGPGGNCQGGGGGQGGGPGGGSPNTSSPISNAGSYSNQGGFTLG